jgi:hypothetical protein
MENQQKGHLSRFLQKIGESVHAEIGQLQVTEIASMPVQEEKRARIAMEVVGGA